MSTKLNPESLNCGNACCYSASERQNNDFASSCVKRDLTSTKRHRLQTFENSVLTELFAAEKDEVSVLFGCYIRGNSVIPIGQCLFQGC
jgi:hypothetical protein